MTLPTVPELYQLAMEAVYESGLENSEADFMLRFRRRVEAAGHSVTNTEWREVMPKVLAEINRQKTAERERDRATLLAEGASALLEDWTNLAQEATRDGHDWPLLDDPVGTKAVKILSLPEPYRSRAQQVFARVPPTWRELLRLREAGVLERVELKAEGIVMKDRYADAELREMEAVHQEIRRIERQVRRWARQRRREANRAPDVVMEGTRCIVPGCRKPVAVIDEGDPLCKRHAHEAGRLPSGRHGLGKPGADA